MLKVRIPLRRTWDDAEDACKYFGDLITDLKFLQSRPDGEGFGLFLDIENDGDEEDPCYNITLIEN